MCNPVANDSVLKLAKQKTAYRGLGNIGSSVANPSKNEIEPQIEKSQRKQSYRNLYVKQRLQIGKKASCQCGRYVMDNAHVNYNPKTKSATYSGVKRCNSVWECPLCRTRIMKSKGEELAQIAEYFGHSATALITFTIPHYFHDSLAKLLGNSSDKTGIKGAIRRMMQHREWRQFCDKYNVIGHVRAIEINSGKNGWHPHYHFALFFGETGTDGNLNSFQLFGKVPKTMNSELSLMENIKKNDELIRNEMTAILYCLWAKVCAASELRTPAKDLGVKVSNGLVEYLAKWGVASELTSASAKEAKNGSMSIVSLETRLSGLYGNYKNLSTLELDEYGKIKAIILEYYETMKGTRLLEWSRNFKKQIDAEIALSAGAGNEDEDEKMVLVSIPPSIYMKIYYRGNYEELLCWAEKEPEYGVQMYVRHLGLDPTLIIPQYKKHSDIPDMNEFIIGKALTRQKEGYRIHVENRKKAKLTA